MMLSLVLLVYSSACKLLDKERHESVLITDSWQKYDSTVLQPYNSSQKLCIYMGDQNNFGDELSYVIVKRLVDLKLQRNVKLQIEHLPTSESGPCLFALGSIFHFVRPGDYVWGTGVNPIHTQCKPDMFKDVEVFGARGFLSIKYLVDDCSRSGVKISYKNISLGDPALLLPFLFPEYRRARFPEHKLCIIPHYNDRNVWHLLEPYKSSIMWTEESYDTVIRYILDCSLVVSSSLHGIVVAEAFGVPARWLSLPGSKTLLTEGTFKYNDYFSATNRSLNDYATSIEQAIKLGGKEPIMNYDAQGLIKSFPFHLL
jgi:pyruvyltransferase